MSGFGGKGTLLEDRISSIEQRSIERIERRRSISQVQELIFGRRISPGKQPEIR